MSDQLPTDPPIEARQFANTHWSVVLLAAQRSKEGAQDALAKLCQTYWYPLYSFVRRQGYGPEDAQDLTQGFFARFLENRALEKVDPAKGKFRSFLLASLRHFLSNERERAEAKKRGSGHLLISLDADAAETRFRLEPAHNTSPDQLFLKNWAITLLEKVLRLLEAEQAVAGKGAQFELLRENLMGDPGAPKYSSMSAKLGLSEDAVKMSVYRLRRRFRELLREEIGQTVSTPEEVDEELRIIFTALS